MQTISYVDYVSILVHRVLAHHKPLEVCDECPAITQEVLDQA